MNKILQYKMYSFRLINASTSTAVKLSSILTSGMGTFVHKAWVQGLPTNTKDVAVGNAPSVTAGSESGYQLASGGSAELQFVDLDQIKMLPTVANEGIILIVFVAQTTTTQDF